MLKLYHAEPGANSLKCLIPLKEKGLAFQSLYVDLHKFEQHEPAFLAINPEGQVPVLDHDGNIVTHSTVINEYLEDRFPSPSLRPVDPAARAHMRLLSRFADEHVMNYVSMHGWHRFIGVLAQAIEQGQFERMVERIPLYEQREKWRTARSGFSESDLANAKRKVAVALDKVEEQLSRTTWLAGKCSRWPTSISFRTAACTLPACSRTSPMIGSIRVSPRGANAWENAPG